MKKHALYLALFASVGLVACASKPAPTPAPAVEKPAASKLTPVAAQVTVFTATVDSVDLKNRTVVLKDANGNLAPMKVAKSVNDLQNVKKGDVFVIEYAQAIALSLVKAPKGATPGISESHTISVSGQKPNAEPFAEETDTVYATAKIVSINTKNQTAVLATPDGKKITVKVDKRVTGLKKFKVGNEVLVEYVQDLAVGFVRPKQ
jgi:hypothetical protein